MALRDGIEIITDEQAGALFDRRAGELLGMSGNEFLRRWHAGEFAGMDEPGIIDMIMLLPLVEFRGGTGGVPPELGPARS